MFLLYCALVTSSSLFGENLDQLAACLWCVCMFLICLGCYEFLMCSVYHMSLICSFFHISLICSVSHMSLICSVYHVLLLCFVSPVFLLSSVNHIPVQWLPNVLGSVMFQINLLCSVYHMLTVPCLPYSLDDFCLPHVPAEAYVPNLFLLSVHHMCYCCVLSWQCVPGVFCLPGVPGLGVFCRTSMPGVWSYPPLIHNDGGNAYMYIKYNNKWS
jgi:hypothetical protein